MKLSEFAEINPPVKLTQGEKYPCVMMDEITPGRRYVFGENQKIFSGGSKFQKGDVLFARITPCLENGKIAQFMGEGIGFGSTEYFIFRERKNISDQTFLFYLASSDIVRKPAEKSMFGASGRQRADLNVVMNVEVPAPSLPTQRRIADILSAYDDLIENNTRRIRILEQMAQAIYVETFHGTSLPKGWRLTNLSEIADVNSSSIKNGNEPEEINYVDIASVSTGKIDAIQPMKFSEAPGRARRIVQHGDVIWSTVRPNRKSYSLIINPPENMVVSTGFAVLRAKTVPFSYLYLATTTDDFAGYLTNHATGSAYPAVNSSDFENAEIVLPPKDLLDKFDGIVSPMFILRETLLAKNANLRQTRDLLLPRLVSGEIAV